MRELKPCDPEGATDEQGRTFTGAWIETVYYDIFYIIVIVAPSRVRELKLYVKSFLL